MLKIPFLKLHHDFIIGHTPLLAAASRGNSDVVLYLLSHGANVNDTNDINNGNLNLI